MEGSQRPTSWFLDRRGWIVPAVSFLALAAAITAAAAVHFRGFDRDLRAQVERELATIAEVKVEQIVEWRRHVLQDATDLQAAGLYLPAVRDSSSPSHDGAKAEMLGRIAMRLRRHRLATGAVFEADGRAVIATTPRDDASEEERAAIDATLRDRQPRIVDLVSEGGAIRVIVPLPDPEGRGAVVLLSGTIHSSLPDSVHAWPTPSRSAEAFLAGVHGEEVVILDALRFTGGTPYPARFRLPGAQFPLALAGRGEEGTGRHLDHRGAAVLAARRRIPDSNWVLSTKVNEREVLAPAAERARSLSIAVVVVILASGAALLSWFRAGRAELRRRERNLEERERVAHLQYAWKHAHDVVLIADPDRRVVDANDRALELYGYSRADLLALRLDDLRAPRELPGLADAARRVLDAPAGVLLETVHRRKDGTEVPVEVSARFVRSGARQLLYCIVRDITDRRRAEQEARTNEERERALQAKLAFSDRLAAIGTLAAGVAHEINNPLSYLLSSLDFLRDGVRGPERADAPTPDALAEAVEESREGARRIAEIVRALRTFSRQDGDPGPARPLDLREPVQAALRIASKEIRNRGRLRLALGDVPPVAAPEHELAQIAVNLLMNAAQAIPEGRPEAHEVSVTTRAEAECAVLEVKDTGTGIAPAHLGRIFDPFFTTKPVGQGTGLGLAVCLGIVERLGGRIEVDSSPGAGSTFRVVLPSADTRPAATGADDAYTPSRVRLELAGATTDDRVRSRGDRRA